MYSYRVYNLFLGLFCLFFVCLIFMEYKFVLIESLNCYKLDKISGLFARLLQLHMGLSIE